MPKLFRRDVQQPVQRREFYLPPTAPPTDVTGQVGIVEGADTLSSTTSPIAIFNANIREGRRPVAFPERFAVLLKVESPDVAAGTVSHDVFGTLARTEGADTLTSTTHPDILLEWDATNVVGETGFRVKWGTTSNVYTTSVDVGVNVQSYLITTGLVVNTNYFWRVVALVGAVEQTPSAEATFETFP